ncbi:hypothetical protein CSC43_6130 [Pseudomonas aeruginosa]|nr:hypothetical protein CSB90_5326 [Pseudomonas aeruginosa]KJJ17634.1 hypothetical protein HMPREF3150_03065 [Pseudomonas aeruginosa]RCH29648.1 hypothetical protein CSC43_6130 [Pseudomonas aeruginosa]
MGAYIEPVESGKSGAEEAFIVLGPMTTISASRSVCYFGNNN